VRRRLEDVGPNVVQQVVEGVLAAETVDAQRHVLDHGAGRLSVDQIPAGEDRERSELTAVGRLLYDHNEL